MISVIGLFSCSIKEDEPRFYEIIQPEIPQPETPKYEIPVWVHFEVGYDALDFLIENPPLELQHIYEIQCCDKMIAERVKNQKIYKEPLNETEQK